PIRRSTYMANQVSLRSGGRRHGLPPHGCGYGQRATDMEARIHVITLAVSDLDRALAFYRQLGLESQGVVGTEFTGDDDRPAGAIALFRLDGGLILSLYPRTELAKDAQVPFGPPKSGEFSIGHLVARREDVDVLLDRAEAAGATRTAPAHDRPWGIYSGYFRDPDGHLWEIIWNPR
ncbi:MAG TPA: VOC family protein, partial [Gaiellales bacterium]|nr:VOC family protein [Gaiellales bacterium]